MWWLFAAIASYTLLAVASLIDKVLLSGKLSNPKIYAFYVGILSAVAFLLLPLGAWANPAPLLFLTGIAAGAAQIYGSFFYLSALQKLEASRAVPIIGGLVPIFGFFLTVAVSGGVELLDSKELAGFFLLILGSWLIMANGIRIKSNQLGYILGASLLFAASVVLAKLVYLQLSFIPGFVLMAFGSTLAAISFMSSRAVRAAVFGHHRAKDAGQPSPLFFVGQAMGGLAFMTQSLAVSMAPQANVPVINAMAGVQYVFIFTFSFFLARHYPKLFREKKHPAAVAKKLFAIVLLMVGLAIFAIN
ncbi:MAG: hypothetical protein MUD10_01845 [Candidatus Pacebacteria bacterium]|jgi:hypothetical protein|nr:hypothetical protein [Candidatus Paceibacterota bacterium]